VKQIRDKLLGIFQGEHQDHSGQIRTLLRRIVEAEGPGPDLDEAFRRAHSLKGAARAVGLEEIETVGHRLEALFARAREGSLRIDQPAVDVIHDALDCSEDLLANLSGERPAPNTARVLEAIDALLAGERPAPSGGNQPRPEKPLAGQAEFAPADDASGEENAEVDAPDGVEGSSSASVRLRASHVDSLLRTCDQLSTAGPQHRAVTRALHQLTDDVAKLMQRWEHIRRGLLARETSGAESNSGPSRRSLEEMDGHFRSLATRSRRLLLEQRRNASSLERFSDDLRLDLWKARMTPASSVLDGFGSMVRELARSQQKAVRFRAVGLDTEADREVFQALREPVLHLLRNAVGHGLETPAEREQAGKPASGQVTLAVEAAAGLLTLRVHDDGRGIDLARVAEEARRRGKIEESETSRSDEQLRQLLFEPGFSTAAAVSEIAGRGMGLSVVQETVRRLHGDVEAHSTQGSGTEVVVRTPLSVLTQRVLLVQAGGRIFAFSVRAIERVSRVAADEIKTVEGRPAIGVGDCSVPLVSLGAVLDLATVAQRGSRSIPVVIVDSGTQAIAFAVDELLDQREAVVRDLGIPEAKGGVAAGGIMLEEGSIAILLNVAELTKAAAQSSGGPAQQSAALPLEQRQRRILLADDSITTRALEKSILEVHGYEVLAAVDGVEALAMLRSQGADLVISDVQMPRMDGFELLEQIKNDKRLRQTPVIILTSLERREEQEKGLALGADAYIVKRKFDQRDLLETIRQIL
jgi:two-component system chemotaxis sensor kinase CheA